MNERIIVARYEVRRDLQVLVQILQMLQRRLFLEVIDFSIQVLEGMKRPAKLLEERDFFLSTRYKNLLWTFVFSTVLVNLVG